MSYHGKRWEFVATCPCGFDIKVHSGQGATDRRHKRDRFEVTCAGCGRHFAGFVALEEVKEENQE